MSEDARPPAEPITDARTIRALAHPLRLRILDVLGEHGPLTATQVSDHVSESPQSCSFHLRTLAKYGYVEDAGGGQGRNRPWKVSDRTTYFRPVDADPETVEAIESAQAVIDASYQEHVRGWRRRARQAPRVWQENTFEMAFDTWLTPAEVAQVSAKISAAIRSVVEGRTSKLGQGRVLLHASGFPIGTDLPDSPETSVKNESSDDTAGVER
ncbi:helix-turn-helix transcriptional regulator [Microlunatus elymi]|uniref:Helix-turn-helix transcriptional regulator n=1 Tax=Microlunatus elymi TaxID=2596828 RepID=A0A516PWX2_9ACTN|nr:helix-turn-helix domain-containing protein [Microlunatus elymi]QDP95441.1 helix-turn-helix transcriptional regulator [Microlunatus elymi]